MSNFRRLVKALVDPVAAQYKNDTFCCEIDEFDSQTRDEAIDFIRYYRTTPDTGFGASTNQNPAEMSEEDFFKETVIGTDGYWGSVPVRLMTTDFILSVLEDFPHAASGLPVKFITDNPDVLNYIKSNMENNESFKNTYDWLIEKGFIQ
jgi:hypothetical protein